MTWLSFFILPYHELHNVYIGLEDIKSQIKFYNLIADFIHSFILQILLSATMCQGCSRHRRNNSKQER